MASPQKENGYTAIANEIVDVLILHPFPRNTGLPLKLCLFVIRKTYGYHKKMDIISLSQFQKATNETNRTNLVRWLNYLVQAKILVKIKKSEMATEWGFNKNYEEWGEPVQMRALVQTRLWGSANAGTKTSANAGTHKRKKEIYTKETPAPRTDADVIEAIESFKTVNPSYSKWFANTTQRGACERMLKTHGLERLKEIIALLHTTNGKRYFPTITTPLQLEDGMAKLEAALRRAQEPELANKRGFVM